MSEHDTHLAYRYTTHWYSTSHFVAFVWHMYDDDVVEKGETNWRVIMRYIPIWSIHHYVSYIYIHIFRQMKLSHHHILLHPSHMLRFQVFQYWVTKWFILLGIFSTHLNQLTNQNLYEQSHFSCITRIIFQL